MCAPKDRHVCTVQAQVLFPALTAQALFLALTARSYFLRSPRRPRKIDTHISTSTIAKGKPVAIEAA